MSIITNGSHSLRHHRRWLRLQLSLEAINYDYLIALMILLERVVHHEQQRLLRRPLPMPFYNLSNGDGKESHAWVYAAEGALWLRYRHYDPAEWFQAICSWPKVRRRLLFGQQVPLNLIMPATRLSLKHLRAMEQFYLQWRHHHA